MAYDYNKLKGKIIEKFGNQLEFAKAMNWSERTTTLKLNSKVYWKQPEINKAMKLLEIPNDELQVYFFTQVVQKN